jgi:hypothetical protein
MHILKLSINLRSTHRLKSRRENEEIIRVAIFGDIFKNVDALMPLL